MTDRILIYVVYVVAMLLVWGIVVRQDWRRFRLDPRDATEDLVADSAMLVAATAGAFSLASVGFGIAVVGLKGFLFALFLGGFLGAGIARLTLRRNRTR